MVTITRTPEKGVTKLESERPFGMLQRAINSLFEEFSQSLELAPSWVSSWIALMILFKKLLNDEGSPGLNLGYLWLRMRD